MRGAALALVAVATAFPVAAIALAIAAELVVAAGLLIAVVAIVPILALAIEALARTIVVLAARRAVGCSRCGGGHGRRALAGPTKILQILVAVAPPVTVPLALLAGLASRTRLRAVLRRLLM